MRGAQDVAVAVTSMLADLVPAQMASIRSRYSLVNTADDGGLEDFASYTDTAEDRVESDQYPALQVEILGKRTTPSGGVEPENGGGITLDRRLPARIWVFLRGQSYPDVSHRQRYTAQAVEEVLMGNVVLPSDATIRLDPTTVAYDLSDVGLDPRSSRSVGGIKFTFDVVITESVAPPTPLGTANTIDLEVDLIHPALA